MASYGDPASRPTRYLPEFNLVACSSDNAVRNGMVRTVLVAPDGRAQTLPHRDAGLLQHEIGLASESRQLSQQPQLEVFSQQWPVRSDSLVNLAPVASGCAGPSAASGHAASAVPLLHPSQQPTTFSSFVEHAQQAAAAIHIDENLMYSRQAPAAPQSSATSGYAFVAAGTNNFVQAARLPTVHDSGLAPARHPTQIPSYAPSNYPNHVSGHQTSAGIAPSPTQQQHSLSAYVRNAWPEPIPPPVGLQPIQHEMVHAVYRDTVTGEITLGEPIAMANLEQKIGGRPGGSSPPKPVGFGGTEAGIATPTFKMPLEMEPPKIARKTSGLMMSSPTNVAIVHSTTPSLETTPLRGHQVAFSVSPQPEHSVVMQKPPLAASNKELLRQGTPASVSDPYLTPQQLGRRSSATPENLLRRPDRSGEEPLFWIPVYASDTVGRRAISPPQQQMQPAPAARAKMPSPEQGSSQGTYWLANGRPASIPQSRTHFRSFSNLDEPRTGRATAFENRSTAQVKPQELVRQMSLPSIPEAMLDHSQAARYQNNTEPLRTFEGSQPAADATGPAGRKRRAKSGQSAPGWDLGPLVGRSLSRGTSPPSVPLLQPAPMHPLQSPPMLATASVPSGPELPVQQRPSRHGRHDSAGSADTRASSVASQQSYWAVSNAFTEYRDDEESGDLSQPLESPASTIGTIYAPAQHTGLVPTPSSDGFRGRLDEIADMSLSPRTPSTVSATLSQRSLGASSSHTLVQPSPVDLQQTLDIDSMGLSPLFFAPLMAQSASVPQTPSPLGAGLGLAVGGDTTIRAQGRRVTVRKVREFEDAWNSNDNIEATPSPYQRRPVSYVEGLDFKLARWEQGVFLGNEGINSEIDEFLETHDNEEEVVGTIQPGGAFITAAAAVGMGAKRKRG